MLLIHGTFASSEGDVGPAWWQVGSPFRAELNRLLAGRARCHDPGEVFHWSGANSEDARRLAGERLLERLLGLEGRGQPYYLIGHSHGGNVIRAALQRAGRFGGLPHLRGWASVGTPFLHFRYSPASFLATLGLMLLLDAAALGVAQLFRGPGTALRLALLLPLVLAHFWALGLLLALNNGLIEWVLSRALRRDRAPRPAYAWLGVWSRYDEAINALMSSTDFRAALTPRVRLLAFLRPPAARPRPRLRAPAAGGRVWLSWLRERMGRTAARATVDPRYFAWLFRLTAAPFLVPFALVFNRAVAPMLDRRASAALQYALQGNDLPLQVLRRVTVSLGLGADEGPAPAVPEAISQDLRAMANGWVGALSDGVRGLLAQAALEKGGLPRLLMGPAGLFSGAELVHCLYFEHPEVIAMLADHVLARCAGAAEPQAP